MERASARLFTTITVSNTNDSGPGSLRQAILEANALVGDDLITITAVGFINLLSPLPTINEAVTIQGPGPSQLAVDGSNSYRVFESAAVTVTMADLTIQNGRPAAGEGGGIRSEGTLALTNVAVLSNTSQVGGGGVYVKEGAYIIGGRFENNRSLLSIGGGFLSPSPSMISGTIFISNTAQAQGGGAHISHSQVIGAHFENNHSRFANGGGLYASGLFTLTNTTLISNTAFGDGGGILAFGQANVYGSNFINNQSGDQGGALYVGSFLTVDKSIFIGNQGGRGGAIFHGVLNGRVENSLFAQNTATSAGAHLFLNGPATVDIVHVTAVGTGSAGGTGVHVVNSSVALTNTIIASHTTGIDNLSGSVSLDYNLYYGNSADTQGIITGGANSVSGSPGFIDPAQNNYHLGAGSAAIDTGTDAAVADDYDGELRPLDGGFDIGFDEANYIAGLAFSHLPSPTITMGLPATFTATVTRGADVIYEWNFGDGTAVVAGNPAFHTYLSPGMVPVVVTATNSSGSLSFAKTITVLPLPETVNLPIVMR